MSRKKYSSIAREMIYCRVISDPPRSAFLLFLRPVFHVMEVLVFFDPHQSPIGIKVRMASSLWSEPSLTLCHSSCCQNESISLHFVNNWNGSLSDPWSAEAGPQKIIGSLPCPIGFVTVWRALFGQTLWAHGRGRSREKAHPLAGMYRGVGRLANQKQWFLANSLHGFTAPANLRAKKRFLPKRHLISDGVIAGPGQLITHRLGRYCLVCLGTLSLVVAAKTLVVSSGMMRGLNKGPGKIAIAVFSVSLSLLLAIG